MTTSITVIARKFDGSVSRSWNCELLERDGALLTFVGEFDRDVEHSDLGLIRRGTISYEYYWLDRWYNVFRFHESDGSLRNYYCNINMPPIFVDNVVDYIDLDIDVLVSKDATYKVLDLEDFELNSEKFGYTDEIKSKVRSGLADVIALIQNREFPFDHLG